MSFDKMRVLQIGTGSMGTRRLRTLSKRHDVSLAVFDRRADRREKAVKSFSIPIFEDIQSALSWKPEAIVISTPPDNHDEYIELALQNGLHHFCEENIWTYDFQKVEEISKEKHLVSVVSCSFHFLPLIKELKKLLRNELGDLHAYQMLLSTYMPTWHPEEGIEFYARHRHTAAAREMVPFELVYLNDVFAPPAKVAGSVGYRGKLDNKSEDTWSLQMELINGAYGQLTVLQGSPSLARKGSCLGTNGRIDFNVVSGEIIVSINQTPDKTFNYGPQKEVLEATYDEEINTFIETIQGKVEWPHSYYHSSVATATLAASEKSSVTGRWETIDPTIQPAHVPCDYKVS